MSVVVIDINIYLILVLLELTCHLREIEIGVFLAALIVKVSKLGSSNQKGSLSTGKNIGVVLVPWCTWKCISIAIFGGVNIPRIPWCHLLQKMSSHRGSK